MARDTYTAGTSTSFFAINQFCLTEMNHHNNITPMTTTTNTSLESSGSDPWVECLEVQDSDFFSFEHWPFEQESSVGYGHSVENYGFSGNVSHEVGATSHNQNEGENSRANITSRDRKEKVAFRMMSDIDVVDDGYKWRKYGKKMVKNSPNPRNYYKCSIDGCPVKKRVERDRDDIRYVITTYEGNHNHQSTH